MSHRQTKAPECECEAAITRRHGRTTKKSSCPLRWVNQALRRRWFTHGTGDRVLISAKADIVNANPTTAGLASSEPTGCTAEPGFSVGADRYDCREAHHHNQAQHDRIFDSGRAVVGCQKSTDFRVKLFHWRESPTAGRYCKYLSNGPKVKLPRRQSRCAATYCPVACAACNDHQYHAYRSVPRIGLRGEQELN